MSAARQSPTGSLYYFFRRYNFLVMQRNGLSFQEIPVTWGLVGMNVLTFFFAFLGMRTGLGEILLRSLALTHLSHLSPWTFLTWPLVAGLDVLGLVLNTYFFVQFGGSLERSWGTKVFGGFVAATTALTGLTLWLGMLLLRAPILESGLWLPMTAIIVAWATINRRETVRLAMILPMPALWAAAIGVVFAFFHVSMAGVHPLLGLFALSGCGAAYWYVVQGRNLRTNKKKSTDNVRFVNFGQELREDKNSKNPFTRAVEEKKRRERDKKLEEMFRRSGYDDDGNRS
jgi:membrane associated rhomboid family serine protease